ncbi:MAG: PLP-dependent transferase [Thermomicrobiales bacterium]
MTDGRIVPNPGAHLSTRVAHSGAAPTSAVWPLSEPLALSTVYASHDPAIAELRAAAHPPEPNYARDGLPNVRALEQAVARLECAEDALAVPSGMAAIAVTLLALLRAGDHVVTVDGGYCEIRGLLAEEMARFDVVTTCAAAGAPEFILESIEPRTRLIILESIANPSLRVADIAAIAAGARARGVLVCVDNTLATPMLCHPLELGAHLVWHSATKYLGGHHDLVAGVVAGSTDLITTIRRQSQRLGMTLGAFDAWLALRGIHTLAPRMSWICTTAAAIARFLEAHPAVAAVGYPGLPSHPDAALATRTFPDGAGGIVTCTLRDGAAAAAQCIRKLQLIPFALSLGGPVTTVCYPPQFTADQQHADPRSATLRFSIGLESAADLIADLEQALAPTA